MQRSSARAAGVIRVSLYFAPREQEVLALVSAGLTNKDIADLLGLADSTIKGMISSLLSGLGLRTRSGLTSFVIRHSAGITSTGSTTIDPGCQCPVCAGNVISMDSGGERVA